MRRRHQNSSVRRAMDTYRVNEPQAVAILSALNSTGFALIQGLGIPPSLFVIAFLTFYRPPGTGKTWTICGMVGGIPIDERTTSHHNPSREITIGSGKAVRKKILLCAPSNAAIDEVAKTDQWWNPRFWQNNRPQCSPHWC